MKLHFVKTEKRFLVLILISLTFFLIPLVIAPPPVETTTQPGSLEIIANTYEYNELKEDRDFYWHVFNTTHLLTNTTTTCAFHLYSKNLEGEHIYTNNNVKGYSNKRDFEVEINGNNFSTIGDYCYLIECNTTGQTGGYRSCFEITTTGKGSNMNFYIIILLISAGLIVLGFAMKDPSFVLFGSFGLYFIALYILFNGIVGVKDLVTTWAIGIILLGVAAYISIRAAHDLIEAD